MKMIKVSLTIDYKFDIWEATKIRSSMNAAGITDGDAVIQSNRPAIVNLTREIVETKLEVKSIWFLLERRTTTFEGLTEYDQHFIKTFVREATIFIAEVMYVSMCGTGAGWSVESQNVQKLPQIKVQSGKKLQNYIISDDKEGWCDALIHGMETWANGHDVEFDYSQIRPSGARLKTMGGKASGPDPLRRLLDFTRAKILTKQVLFWLRELEFLPRLLSCCRSTKSGHRLTCFFYTTRVLPISTSLRSKKFRSLKKHSSVVRIQTQNAQAFCSPRSYQN